MVTIHNVYGKAILYSLVRQSSKKYLVCVARQTIFLDKKATKKLPKFGSENQKNSNIAVFENFRIMSWEKQ